MMKATIVSILLALAVGTAAAAAAPQLVQAAAKREKPAPRKGPGTPPAKPAAKKNGSGKKIAALSDPDLKKNLETARADLRANADQLAEQHTRWENLDKDLAKARAGIGELEGQLAAARAKADAHQQAIADLQKAHDKVHAAETALKKAIAAHETELRRRAEVAKLLSEARKLQQRAEALKKQADVLRGE